MRYSKIKNNDVINGEGICVSLWTQGCPHHCKGCFNVDTWDYNGGQEFEDKDAYRILELLDANGVSRNLSILGGEPLCSENVDGVIRLCEFIKSKRPHTRIYIWTGYVYEELGILFPLSKLNADVIIDGRFVEKSQNMTLKLRGSENQRVIDVKATIATQGEKIVKYLE